MVCKRCEDIHTAQKDGKTQEECKCNCHNEGVGGAILWNDGGNILCGDDTASVTGSVNFVTDLTQGFPAQTCNCVGFGHLDNCVIGIEELNANSAVGSKKCGCKGFGHDITCEVGIKQDEVNAKSSNKKCTCDYRKGGHDKNCEVFK